MSLLSPCIISYWSIIDYHNKNHDHCHQCHRHLSFVITKGPQELQKINSAALRYSIRFRLALSLSQCSWGLPGAGISPWIWGDRNDSTGRHLQRWIGHKRILVVSRFLGGYFWNLLTPWGRTQFCSLKRWRLVTSWRAVIPQKNGILSNSPSLMAKLPYLRVDCLRNRGRTPCIVAYMKSLYVADTREFSSHIYGPPVMDIVHIPRRNTQLRRNLGRQLSGRTLVLQGVHSQLYSFTLHFCRTQSEHLCWCVHLYSFCYMNIVPV